MLPSHEIEDVLERFRDWLTAANEELEAPDIRALAERLSNDGIAVDSRAACDGSVGLLQIAETVTALRHDLKLQSKSVRSLRETTETALEGLHRATERLDNSQQDATRAAEQAVRPHVEKLLTLDELIGQAADSVARISTPSEELFASRFESELNERYHALPRWRRMAAAFWHRKVCDLLQDDQRTTSTSLKGFVDGICLLRTRAAAALADLGIDQIECLGRRVDPSKMRVIDVVEAAGRPPETVVEVIRPGYSHHGNVIRFAEVRATREALK